MKMIESAPGDSDALKSPRSERNTKSGKKNLNWPMMQFSAPAGQ